MWNRGDLAVAKHSFVCDCGRQLTGGSIHRVEHVEYVTEAETENGEYLALRGDSHGHYWWHDHFRKLAAPKGQLADRIKACKPQTTPAPGVKELEPAQ